MIEVIEPGLYTTIQDLGRPGFYAMGLPPSGALDMFSHCAANALVGNTSNASTLEITFAGPALKFSAASTIALVGAKAEATLDGEEIEAGASIRVNADQVLRFGLMRTGARTYLAVRGGIDVPQVMGSRSTYVLSRIGGLDGRVLRAGDRLTIGDEIRPESSGRGGVTLPAEYISEPKKEQELRVVPGLCDYRLTKPGLESLFGSPYRVSPEANRTGYRFSGEHLEFVDREAPFGAGDDPSNVVNLGYPIGSIQSPSGSELICLMRDAITGGGYATLGTVIMSDLDRIAQMRLPDVAYFVQVDLDVALAERKMMQQRLIKVVELGNT